MRKIINRFKRLLPSLMILWSISVSIFVASLINHPQLKLTGKEYIPDYYFTVELEKTNGFLPYYISFAYIISYGLGGEEYSFEKLDGSTYKLFFPYGANDHRSIQGQFDAVIYIRNISGKFKSFVVLQRSFGDIIPDELDYYTNISCSSFKYYLNHENRKTMGPIPKYHKLNITKVIVDCSKNIYNLEFFRSVKLLVD